MHVTYYPLRRTRRVCANAVAVACALRLRFVVSKWHQDLLVSHIIVLYVRPPAAAAPPRPPLPLLQPSFLLAAVCLHSSSTYTQHDAAAHMQMSLHGYKPVDVDTLGAALQLPKAKTAEHFRALGCRLRAAKRAAEPSAEGASPRPAGGGKTAEITIPFTLPQPRRGRAP